MASDPDSPEVVADMASEQEAVQVVADLESVGIEAHLWGSDGGGVWAGEPLKVRVAVRRADADRAREVLATFDGGRPPVNWNEIDAGDPE